MSIALLLHRAFCIARELAHHAGDRKVLHHLTELERRTEHPLLLDEQMELLREVVALTGQTHEGQVPALSRG